MEQTFREYDGWLRISDHEIEDMHLGGLFDTARACSAVLATAARTSTQNDGPGPEEVRDAQRTATKVATQLARFGQLGVQPA